ncbi:MAG: polysaccharide deacetylase family protein [Bacteroidales bacterium]|nr:polysaccharide deacetylase family protein [Bacteroidales bacterium]
MQRLAAIILLVASLLAGCSEIPDPDPVDNPRVVILMYHRITQGEAGNLYERSAGEFEKDLLYLRKNRIEVIDFNDLAAIVSGERKLASHAAIITFDDGDHSWYTVAMPLLNKYRMKATFFLWASKIGADSFLSWDEVELMSSYAWDGGVRPFSFGSHTMSHHYLMTMKEATGAGDGFQAYLDEELGGSKVLIERNIYGTVEALALPYGDGAGDPDIIDAALRHGYRFIRTSERNVTGIPSSDLLRLPSLPLLDDTEQVLIGGYLGIE